MQEVETLYKSWLKPSRRSFFRINYLVPIVQIGANFVH